MKQVLLAVLMCVAACGKDSSAKGSSSKEAAAPPRPASVTQAQEAALDQMVVIIEDVGKGLDGAKDCKTMTVLLHDANSRFATIAAPLESIDEKDPAGKAWFDARYVSRLKAAARSFPPALRQCHDDPQFKTEFEQLPMMRKKHRT